MADPTDDSQADGSRMDDPSTDDPQPEDARTDNPFQRVVGPWGQVIEDMHATASDYRDAGRTVVELHPGDVTVLTGEPRTAAGQRGSYEPEPRRLGFDVVVPGNEFERLRSVLDDRSVDEYQVFRATANGIVFLLLALESDDDLAVLVPAYYDLGERETLESIAREHGLYAHVRPLSDDLVVTVELDDPEPFFPD